MLFPRLITAYVGYGGGKCVSFQVKRDITFFRLVELAKLKGLRIDKGYFAIFYVTKEGAHHRALLIETIPSDDSPTFHCSLYPLRFPVRFAIEIKEPISYEIFYYYLKQIVAKGALVTTPKVLVNLKALEFQEQFGNRESKTVLHVKCPRGPKANCPTDAGRAALLEVWARKRGTSSLQAKMKYLSIVDKLPQYGVQYYPVWNSSSKENFLGLSVVKLAIYDSSDTVWPLLEIGWSKIVAIRCSGKRLTIVRKLSKQDKLRFYVEKESDAIVIARQCAEYKKRQASNLFPLKLLHNEEEEKCVTDTPFSSLDQLNVEPRKLWTRLRFNRFFSIANWYPDQMEKGVIIQTIERVYTRKFTKQVSVLVQRFGDH